MFTLTPKPLSKLLAEIKRSTSFIGDFAAEEAKLGQLEITGVTNDSRAVKKGDAFFCIVGEHQNGDDFAEQAAGKGAACIFSQNPALKCSAPVIAVADTQVALAIAASFIYGNPSSKIRILGVTGTNGKTTTTHLVEHILVRAGHKVGLIGTLGARWPKADGQIETADYGQTTPQAPALQKMLASMVEAGASHVTMEVSSHALALRRFTGCDFASACLTNITQDHMDFHKTMEHYWQAKRHLFELLNKSQTSNRHAIVNLDEPLANEFLKVLNKDVQVLTYSWQKDTDVRLKEAKFDFKGSILLIKTPKGDLNLNLKLNGPFNAYNVMAALAICLGEGVDLATCKSALEEIPGVPGRFQIVGSNSGKHVEEPLCIVDYAHTPDGLVNILKAARVLVPKDGKLIVVFGCGGDRDRSKRPQMGEIAETLGELVIVTSDNPRTEDPQKIIADILAGVTRLSAAQVEPDRAKAISKAIALASSKDVVVVAGKGHETYQILGAQTIDFDDREHVKEALQHKHQQVR